MGTWQFEKDYLCYKHCTNFPFFPAGEDNSETIQCYVENKPNPPGKFKWILGWDDLPENSYSVTTNDRGQELSTLTYKPNLGDSGKKLTCKYLQNDGTQDIEATNPTVIKINVEKRIVPSSPYTVPETFEYGTDAEISLDLELNPEPKDNDIAWKIKSKDSGNEAMMMIGNTGCSIWKIAKIKRV